MLLILFVCFDTIKTELPTVAVNKLQEYSAWQIERYLCQTLALPLLSRGRSLRWDKHKHELLSVTNSLLGHTNLFLELESH